MEHLSTETLARIVDEDAAPDEAEHLSSCEVCTDVLAALRRQTEALAALPEIMPPLGDWEVLEAQLRSEGLVRDPPLLQRLGLAETPSWMRVAATVMLFLSGAGVGAALAKADGGGVMGPRIAEASTVQDAATAVKLAEQSYVDAVALYQELRAREGLESVGTDPISRYAALEHLVMVSEAAVRQAPGDPYLNGFLVSALAERDAAARLVSARRDNWF